MNINIRWSSSIIDDFINGNLIGLLNYLLNIEPLKSGVTLIGELNIFLNNYSWKISIVAVVKDVQAIWENNR